MDNGQKQIQDEEGRVPYVYKDSEGLWTIAVGCLIDQRGGGLDDEEIDFLFNHRYAKKRAELLKAFPWVVGLSIARFDALMNMSYQLGVSGLSHFHNMMVALGSGDWDKAYTEAKDSLWAKQTPERAERVATQLKTGIYQWKSTGKQ